MSSHVDTNDRNLPFSETGFGCSPACNLSVMVAGPHLLRLRYYIAPHWTPGEVYGQTCGAL